MTGSRPKATLRGVLDGLSSVVLIVAGCVLVWRLIPRQSQATPTPAIPAEPLSIAGAPVAGSPAARVAVVVFSDFQCPYCGKFARETLPEIEQKYIEKGLVRLAFRHMPLNIHPRATRAAEGSECAMEQGQFWPMHAQLFGDGAHLEDDDLRTAARSIHLDLQMFDRCLAKQDSAPIDRDLAIADTLKVKSTPTFFLGTVGAADTVTVRQVIAGARSLATFEKAIEALLKESTR